LEAFVRAERFELVAEFGNDFLESFRLEDSHGFGEAACLQAKKKIDSVPE
jgi:hypothetical protein